MYQVLFISDNITKALTWKKAINSAVVDSIVHVQQHGPQGNLVTSKLLDLIVIYCEKQAYPLRNIKVIKQSLPTTQVLVVLGHNQTAMCKQYFAVGADDCCGTFTEEITARVIRLSKPKYEQKIKISHLELDLSTQFLRCGKEQVYLRAKEIELLKLLYRHIGSTISHHQLRDFISENSGRKPWEQNTLEVHVSNLRKRLDKLRVGNWLQTVYGIGYRLQPK